MEVAGFNVVVIAALIIGLLIAVTICKKAIKFVLLVGAVYIAYRLLVYSGMI